MSILGATKLLFHGALMRLAEKNVAVALCGQLFGISGLLEATIRPTFSVERFRVRVKRRILFSFRLILPVDFKVQGMVGQVQAAPIVRQRVFKLG